MPTTHATVNILIVDDNDKARARLIDQLRYPDIRIVGESSFGAAAASWATRLDVDLVIVAVEEPLARALRTVELLTTGAANWPIVAVSTRGDRESMRKAMLAGARDFLTKPPMGDELISAIRRAGALAQSERSKSVQVQPVQPAGTIGIFAPGYSTPKGKIVTVYSPKGGSGCTTIAVNLAITLHNEDTRVALVDGNFQFGDVAVFVNEQGKNTVVDLAPRAEELDPEIVEEVMLKHSASGLHILAAPSRPEYAEKVSSGQFARVLEYLKQIYSYVVIDTASLLTDVTLAAIDISDLIVLVSTQDIPAIKNCRLFLDLSQTLGIERERILFAMNRYDKRINITPERVAENLKQEVSAVIPLDEQTVVKAVNRGVPFVLESKNQPATRGILSLAESVRARIAVQEAAEEPNRLGRR